MSAPVRTIHVHRLAIAHDCLITANIDGSIPLNSRVIAEFAPGKAPTGEARDILLATPQLHDALLRIARLASAATHSTDPVALAMQIEQIAREAMP